MVKLSSVLVILLIEQRQSVPVLNGHKNSKEDEAQGVFPIKVSCGH